MDKMDFYVWDFNITQNITNAAIRETNFYELVSQSLINLLYFDKNNTYLPFYTDSRIASVYLNGIMLALFLVIIIMSIAHNNQEYTNKSIDMLENIHIRSLAARVEHMDKEYKSRIQTLETQLKDLEDYVAMYCVESS